MVREDKIDLMRLETLLKIKNVFLWVGKKANESWL